MQLINNQYYIIGKIREEKHYTLYNVQDIQKANQLKYLMMIENHKDNEAFIKFMKSNIYDYSNLSHPNIAQYFFFNKVITLDNKPIVKSKYYLTIENLDGQNIFEASNDLGFEEKLDLVIQLCSAVKYLHLKGYLLCNIRGNEIYLVKRYKKNILKLGTIPYPQNLDNNNILKIEDNLFKAPEIYKRERYSKLSDIYMLGIIMFYFMNGIEISKSSFIKDIISFKSNEDSNFIKIKDIISRCTNLDLNLRYQDLLELVEDINKKFCKNYKIINKNSIERVQRYKSKLIVEKKYINKILELAKGFFYEEVEMRGAFVEFMEGSLKSEFINTLSLGSNQEGYISTIISMNKEAKRPFEYITPFIKELFTNCDKDTYSKYNELLIYIFGEMASDICNSLSEESTMNLKFRFLNFITEAVSKTTRVLIAENFFFADKESLGLIKLVFQNNRCRELFIILSADEVMIDYYKNTNDYKEIVHESQVHYVRLINYNITETGTYIQTILGTTKIPMNFTEEVYNYTGGTPEYIYAMLNTFINNEDIYVDKTGEWVFDRVKFNELNILFNLNEINLDKIKGLEPIYQNALRVCSIYEGALSPQLLASQMGIATSSSLEILNYFSYIDIMHRKVDDFGISYDFKSANLKKSIYDKLLEDEKAELHLAAAIELEEIGESSEYKNNNELIFHLVKSNRSSKAIDLLINNAKEFSSGNLINQAIQVLFQAYELFKSDDTSHKKLRLCNELGKLYIQINSFDNSIKFLNEAEQLAIIHNDQKSLIDVYVEKINISHRVKEDKNTLYYIRKAKQLLRDVEYYEGFYEYILCLNDFMMDKRRYHSYIRILYSALINIDKNRFQLYYARLLVQYGINLTKARKLGGSIDILQEAATVFEELGEYKYLPQVYNAIGTCYLDMFNDYSKSKDYYEKALGVSVKTNNLKYAQKIYNNIAELYREQDKYPKAMDYYKQSLETAKAIQRKYDKILVDLNIALLYISMEDYYNVLKLFDNIQAVINENKDLGDITKCFYEIRAEYYYRLGYYELAKAYIQKSVDMCISWGIPHNMEAILLKRMAEIHITEKLNFKQDMVLCKGILEDNMYKRGRVTCLQFAEIYASNGLQDEAREFMKLGLSYVDKIETDILRVEYKYIDAITSNEEDKQIKLIQAATYMENIENLEIKWKIYKAIAKTYQNKKEYQDALKYYISALNILRKLVHNVPDEYKTTFILSHDRNTVKEGLRDISEMIMNSKGLSFDAQTDVNKITLQNLDKYFDYTNYIDIYREGEEEEVSEVKVDAGTYSKLLNKIRDLINKFSENNIENIKNIVDLCTEITQAKNAFIAILDEEDNLDILASYNRYSENSFYKYVIEQVKQKKDSIIVTDVFEYNNSKGDLLIPKEITSVFCIPIMGTKNEDELGLIKERRKQKIQNESTIIGYIYLDTDSIINNFTQESIHFCKLLSKVAYILVDNYNLKMVSTVDKLTKLYTRKYFETALQIEIDYSETEGMEFSVIMIDIDNFKTVNDRFGHQRGDEILQGVSGTIVSALRKGDIAARYGGEEIIILLPNTGEEEGINVAEKLRKKVENARLLGLHNPLTISVGVSTYPNHSTWTKDLIEKADQALYYAKENGKNLSCLYKEDMSKITKRINKLAGIISGNLVEDQRKVETMLEVLELQRSIDINKEEKLFNFLGRIIEVSEAQLGIIFNIEENGEIRKKIVRRKFISTEVEEEYYNKEVVSKCIEESVGEYKVDWNSYHGVDSMTGMPEWQSIMVVPMTKQGGLRGVLYLSAPIKMKEFDAGQYNFIKTLCELLAIVY